MKPQETSLETIWNEDGLDQGRRLEAILTVVRPIASQRTGKPAGLCSGWLKVILAVVMPPSQER